jgi:hypothetical protein
MTAGEIDDAEATHAKGHTPTKVLATVVWAAMDNHFTHPAQENFARYMPAGQIRDTVNAAHSRMRLVARLPAHYLIQTLRKLSRLIATTELPNRFTVRQRMLASLQGEKKTRHRPVNRLFIC